MDILPFVIAARVGLGAPFQGGLGSFGIVGWYVALPRYDVIIGSDLTYRDLWLDELFGTMAAALTSTGTFHLAEKWRDPLAGSSIISSRQWHLVCIHFKAQDCLKTYTCHLDLFRSQLPVHHLFWLFFRIRLRSLD